MSVVLRHPTTREVILYCKGADSAIFDRLRRSPDPAAPASNESLREKTQQQLDLYAKMGLRVLVMSKRVLAADEFLEWETKHKDAEVRSQGQLRSNYDFNR